MVPGYRTIAKFRKDNWKALKAANREFVLVVRELGLVGGEVVAIDGAFFDGNASKASIKTQRKLAKRLAEIDREIEAYGATLEANDRAEAAPAPAGRDGGGGDGEDVTQKVAALMAKRANVQADLARLEESGERQLSQMDADARLLSKNGQVVAGYNVQIAVDDKHKLIVASEVVNDGNGQLHEMAKAAKDALGVETLTALADTGYYNGNALKACEEDGIVAYVPQAKRTARLQAQDRMSHEEFAYEATANVYRCPAGKLLSPTEGRKINGGRSEIRYVSRKADCDACALRARCLSAKTPTRTVYRWEHEAVLERHRARMTDAKAQMRRRAELAEHPFGTLKCRAGYRHFLVRGFDKVRGEWSLMALCHNFTRVLSILGLDRFMAYLAKRRPNWTILLVTVLAVIVDRLQTCRPRLRAKIRPAFDCALQSGRKKFLPSLEAKPIAMEQAARWVSLRSTHPTTVVPAKAGTHNHREWLWRTQAVAAEHITNACG
ncbi:IS1182 family transposase [Bradyrhizobium sp. 31Argb]|uniref:IS1182 family transposase n=1 Tax=Bradyrhizobium sp. 31Argb TaxID=3141247 RepID=UPI003748BC18